MNFLDSFLESSPKILNLVVTFFDFSSKITYFFLFYLRVFVLLCILLYLIPAMYYEYSMGFFGYLVENGVNLNNLVTAFSLELNLPLKILFLLYFLLVELAITNTFLCLFSLIKRKMIKKYNDPLIMLKRGYG